MKERLRGTRKWPIIASLQKKSSEVSIKTRLPPASFSFKGQAIKHTTVKWSISMYLDRVDAYADNLTQFFGQDKNFLTQHYNVN